MNTAQLVINRLRVLASIGVLPHELGQPQPLEISLKVTTSGSPGKPERDELELVVDYRLLRQIAIDECTKGHVHLVETLAGRISERIQQAVPGIRNIEISIMKLDVFEDCESAGIVFRVDL